MTHEQVLDFWFNELAPKQWWDKDTELDRLICDRFADLHQRASHCELYPWRKTAHGRLAEIIVLDQFSRNMFRDSARAFAQDSLALGLAQEAVAWGADQELEPVERNFLYMPYMHSESAVIHEVAEQLFRDNGMARSYEYERKHQAIIARFGRYPHRNAVLGRTSTEEERDFLRQPGSRF
ncbi:MAG: DUF924 domain-containing protein [Desulfuromonadales bacterium]|jgi:uncharacterized protein (DUF924 family)